MRDPPVEKCLANACVTDSNFENVKRKKSVKTFWLLSDFWSRKLDYGGEGGG
jgi:hypothetical protein